MAMHESDVMPAVGRALIDRVTSSDVSKFCPDTILHIDIAGFHFKNSNSPCAHRGTG